MKKYLAVLALALLFSVVAGSGVASATHSTSDNPPHDFAVGSGHVALLDASVAFSAISGPLGENPRGHYRVQQESTVLQGPVTCLATAGNRAVVGGPREGSPGNGVFIVVEDNGTSSDVAPDRFNIASFFLTQESCNQLLLFGISTFPIDRGNLTVHDAPPDVTP